MRRTVSARVSVWDYAAGDFRPLAELPSPLLRVASIPDAYCRHQRFPAHFFPEPLRWSRKGFLLTRWRLGPRVADMLNVHLFHADPNPLSLWILSGASRPRTPARGVSPDGYRLGYPKPYKSMFWLSYS